MFYIQERNLGYSVCLSKWTCKDLPYKCFSYLITPHCYSLWRVICVAWLCIVNSNTIIMKH